MSEDSQDQQNFSIPEANNIKETAFEINLHKEVEQVIKDLPEEKKTEVKALIRAISIKRETFRSPLPPPQILKGYNEIIPNGAERILAMAEKQSDHRMTMEKTVINREQNQSGKGQNYGLAAALSFLAVSGILIYNGHEASGTILGSIDLVSLVAVFVLGKYFQKKNLDNK